MSAPQVVDQENDKETPQLDQVALFEDRQSVAMDQPEQAAERQDVTHVELSHEEPLESAQHPELSVSIPFPRSDEPSTSLTLEDARLRFKLEPNMTLSQDPDGKLVIQELDSPVTRREKAMRRKRARSQLAAPAVSASSALDGSDLSSLSELSEDEDDEGYVRVNKRIDKIKLEAVQPGQVMLDDGKMLEGGTLGASIILPTSMPTAKLQI
jgi:hypothetical protein